MTMEPMATISRRPPTPLEHATQWLEFYVHETGDPVLAAHAATLIEATRTRQAHVEAVWGLVDRATTAECAALEAERRADQLAVEVAELRAELDDDGRCRCGGRVDADGVCLSCDEEG